MCIRDSLNLAVEILDVIIPVALFIKLFISLVVPHGVLFILIGRVIGVMPVQQRVIKANLQALGPERFYVCLLYTSPSAVS